MSRLLLRVGVAGFAAVAFGAGVSCSLIVDTNANQCMAASDCTSFPGLRTCQAGVCQAVTTAPTCKMTSDCSGYANATCVANACVRGCMADADCGGTLKCNTTTHQCGSAAPTGCTKNMDCMSQGTYAICRKDTSQCVNLVSAECPTVFGSYQDDNAFLFGSVLPITGTDQDTGIPTEHAIEMAIGDFSVTNNGLPPATGSTAYRPLAYVSCSDNSSSMTAVKAAQHLVNDVGVQVIIGGAYSGITTSIATTVTDAAHVLLFSPSATSASLTSLADNGYLWRTSPSDNLQATALNLYVKQVIAGLANKPSPVKIAVLHKGDSYGDGLATQLESEMNGLHDPANPVTPTLNGVSLAMNSSAGNYTNVDYGNPDNPSSDPNGNYNNAIMGAIKLLPHIIFVLGTNECITNVVQPIENQWPTATPYRPIYIFADGGEVSGLTMLAAQLGDQFRTRVSGTVPGGAGPVYDTFIGNYKSKYPNDPPAYAGTFGAAGGYDIVYLLSYSVVGETSVTGKPGVPITADNLIKGFSRLVPATGATAINAGPGTAIQTAFGVLTQNTGNIDYNGASGPLDFKIMTGKTGEADSDIQIWCVGKGAAGGPTTQNSGLYYDPRQPQLVGSITNCN